jgi:hypothetical protein
MSHPLFSGIRQDYTRTGASGNFLPRILSKSRNCACTGIPAFSSMKVERHFSYRHMLFTGRNNLSHSVPAKIFYGMGNAFKWLGERAYTGHIFNFLIKEDM